MKNHKTLMLVLLVVAARIQAQDGWYLTTNPLAALAGIEVGSAELKALIPLFTNLEYGASANLGLIKGQHLFEGRLNLGRSNPYTIIPQLQLGYGRFPFESRGYYVGSFLRYWDYINTYTGVHTQSYALSLTLGHMWKQGRFIADLRLNQSLAVYSWSSLEYATPAANFVLSPMPELLPVLPFFSFSAGWRL